MSTGDQRTPSPSIMASLAPNVMNPGAAQPSAGLMGQSVGVSVPPPARPAMSQQDAMMQALLRRMG